MLNFALRRPQRYPLAPLRGQRCGTSPVPRVVFLRWRTPSNSVLRFQRLLPASTRISRIPRYKRQRTGPVRIRPKPSIFGPQRSRFPPSARTQGQPWPSQPYCQIRSKQTSFLEWQGILRFLPLSPFLPCRTPHRSAFRRALLPKPDLLFRRRHREAQFRLR